jgi:hypothetical protein
MSRRRSAREIEALAARTRAPRGTRVSAPGNEALAMLVRRGLRPRATRRELPFPADVEGELADQLARHLGHYAFRLFLRGAIQKPDGFTPEEASAYVKPPEASALAEALVAYGIATRDVHGRYRLVRRVHSFGDTLEWYVARELRRRFGLVIAAGVKFSAPGVGGDLDIVGAVEGKLVYLELKSSPPKHLAEAEVAALFDRVVLLRPDITVFVMDTALRLSDKVILMLADELRRRQPSPAPVPCRIARELWALTPHLYAVNAKTDLVANIGRALAEGLRALAPPLL